MTQAEEMKPRRLLVSRALWRLVWVSIELGIENIEKAGQGPLGAAPISFHALGWDDGKLLPADAVEVFELWEKAVQQRLDPLQVGKRAPGKVWWIDAALDAARDLANESEGGGK
jgi:hypothetical protein